MSTNYPRITAADDCPYGHEQVVRWRLDMFGRGAIGTTLHKRSRRRRCRRMWLASRGQARL